MIVAGGDGADAVGDDAAQQRKQKNRNLAEEGIQYVCDWANDEQPYTMKVSRGELYSLGVDYDLDDVYMTVFLPAADAGRLGIGSEARLIMDAAPEYVFPAQVSFVAADAQFTPKSVEIKTEREKLMFRVKLVVPPELVARFRAQVKPGLRGTAYVRTESAATWPEDLAPKLPQ